MGLRVAARGSRPGRCKGPRRCRGPEKHRTRKRHCWRPSWKLAGRGLGIVEDYICNSLVKEQWDEEQTRRMEEMYRREMQEVLGPEQQAYGAEVDASGSLQPLPDPQLSVTSPIGQKPSDVEAVPMT
ncbi:unnamed protein product [Ectocarpus sp. CCAP 1310/34]|nr:unnamed protein product [Ectocarpus sp. CCAP 1310/34]